MGEATIYRLIGAVDRLGMSLFYGLLRTQGFRSVYFDTPCGRIHGLQSPDDPSKILPPAVICSGMGSASTDYILLLLKLKSWYQQVTVLELVGHAYSTEGCPRELNAENVTATYRQILDSLSSEERPVFLIGHSLGGRIALDYVTGRGRELSLAQVADAALAGEAEGSSLTQEAQPPANHGSPRQPSAAASTLIHKRVAGLVLVAAMGAPFSPDDLKKLSELYADVQHWRQAAAIARGAAGTTFADPIMAGATFKRMRKEPVKQLVASELFQKGVPDEELRAVRVPTLLLWGEKDGLVPGEHLSHYIAQLPTSATIKLLPNMSHNNFAMAHGPAVRAMLRFSHRVLAMDAPLGAENARAAAEALRKGEGMGGRAAARWRRKDGPQEPVAAEAQLDAADKVSSLPGGLVPDTEPRVGPAMPSLVRHYRTSTGGAVMFALRSSRSREGSPARGGGKAKRRGLRGFFAGLCGGKGREEEGELSDMEESGSDLAAAPAPLRPIQSAL